MKQFSLIWNPHLDQKSQPTRCPKLLITLSLNPLSHGKAVSRRMFESKLNQITMGKMKCEKSGKVRWIFKNEIAAGFNCSITTQSCPLIID